MLFQQGKISMIFHNHQDTAKDIQGGIPSPRMENESAINNIICSPVLATGCSSGTLTS